MEPRIREGTATNPGCFVPFDPVYSVVLEVSVADRYPDWSLWQAPRIPGLGRSPEKERATHSSILAGEISWAGEPGGLQSMGSQESVIYHHR